MKRVVVTGGTGSLGQSLVHALLWNKLAQHVTVFSRDEAKQHAMRQDQLFAAAARDGRLAFRIGDVRDAAAVTSVLLHTDTVIHTAALKQVPTCEYAPYEAVQTNIVGAENITRAIELHRLPVELVVGVSTDKACKPVNVMGMSKAIQERVFIQANLRVPKTRFVCVRYGNVMGSRGSVIPDFIAWADAGKPILVTTPEMTRFFLDLDAAVELIFLAARDAKAGEIFIPCLPSAYILDVAEVIRADRAIPILFTGIRPGEKVHEILVSEEEVPRAWRQNGHIVIAPGLPELCGPQRGPALMQEYGSKAEVMGREDVPALIYQWSQRWMHGSAKGDVHADSNVG